MKKILVLQPYIGRTIDSMEEVGRRALHIYESITFDNSEKELIYVPNDLKNLFTLEDLDAEDKILGEDSFILSNYIKEISNVDLVLILYPEHWYDDFYELNIFQRIVEELHVNKFVIPYLQIIMHDYKQYTDNRFNKICDSTPVCSE